MEPVPQQERDEAGSSERRQEGESERQAGEIRGDTAKCHQGRTQPTRQAADYDARREKKAENCAAQRRSEADLDAYPIGVEDRRLGETSQVVEGKIPLRVLEAADDQAESRPDQKHRREDEERNGAEKS